MTWWGVGGAIILAWQGFRAYRKAQQQVQALIEQDLRDLHD